MQSEDEESSSEFLNDVGTFHQMITEINDYFIEKSQRMHYRKQWKFKQKQNYQFKMLSNNHDKVQDVVSFNKIQVVKMLKHINFGSDQLPEQEIAPFLDKIQDLLRQVKLQQQILRNVQKRVFLNLVDFYSTHKKNNVKRNSYHIYIAESIHTQKFKPICDSSKRNNIIIPLTK